MTLEITPRTMKLKQISENFIGQKLREMLKSTGPFFDRPRLQMTPLYNANTGHDAGAYSTGSRLMPIGVPHRPRHRNMLGFEKRPGTIRL